MIFQKDNTGPEAPKGVSQSGMTLLELLVVIVILGLIAATVAVAVSGRLDKAKRDTAALQIDQVATALEMYRLDLGAFPTEKQGLDALLTRPKEGADGWRGPYLTKPEALRDPWGRGLDYAPEGAGFSLLSLGADGAPGGEGDDADIGR